MICGLILAGGRSSRFGREKAAADLGGRPLIAWVADVLGRADLLAVNAPPGSAAHGFAQARGLACVPDAPEAEPGPLTGVRAGLRWAAAAGADWLVTAPCDTPFLPSDMVAVLAAGRSAGGAVALTPAGLQPLCALWPIAALARLEAEREHAPVRQVLAALQAARVPFDDDGAFANLNTPGEFEQARAMLSVPAPR